MMSELYTFESAARKIKAAYIFPLVIGIFTLFIFPRSRDCFLSPIPEPGKERAKNYHFPSREASIIPISFPNILAEISFYPICSRPDIKENEKKHLIVLNRSKRARAIGDVDIVFFSCDFKNGVRDFSFSDRETEIGLKTRKSDNDQLEVEVILSQDLKNSLQLNFKEPVVFSIAKDPYVSESLLNTLPFSDLVRAKWWGNDLFNQLYHPQGAPKERLQMEQGGYISEFDTSQYLIFRDGKWLAASGKDDTTLYPLAVAQPINCKELRIKVWDPTGSFAQFSLPLQTSLPFKIRMEDLFLQPKMRTLHRICCNLEKDSFELKTGDALIRKNGKWQLLSSKDKELLRREYSDSEVFVFDGISCTLGRKILKGHLFNGMRTLSEEIKIPLHVKKGKPDAPPPSQQDPAAKSSQARKWNEQQEKNIQNPNQDKGKCA